MRLAAVAAGTDTEVVDADWLVAAEAAVAGLRDEARRRPRDPGLHRAIGELMLHYPVFATLWTLHNEGHDADE